MSGRRGVLVAMAAVALLASCGGTSRSDFDAEVQARGGGLGSSLALEAVDALREELGDDLAFRSFTMTAGQVNVEVLIPGTDDELDSYRYGTSGLYGGGGLSDPTPVAGVGGAAELRPFLFRPERIAFDRFDQVVDDALDQAGIEGAWAETLRVGRSGDRAVITVSIDSPRERVDVTFRGDGTPRSGGDG